MDNWTVIEGEESLPPAETWVFATSRAKRACWALLTMYTGEAPRWSLTDDERDDEPLDYIVAWMPPPAPYDPDAKRAEFLGWGVTGDLILCQCGAALMLRGVPAQGECHACGRVHRLVVEVVTEEASHE